MVISRSMDIQDYFHWNIQCYPSRYYTFHQHRLKTYVRRTAMSISIDNYKITPSSKLYWLPLSVYTNCIASAWVYKVPREHVICILPVCRSRDTLAGSILFSCDLRLVPSFSCFLWSGLFDCVKPYLILKTFLRKNSVCIHRAVLWYNDFIVKNVCWMCMWLEVFFFNFRLLLLFLLYRKLW